MMLKDYSINQLIHKLSEIINVPVILLNHSLDILTPIDILDSNYKLAVSHIIDLIKNDKEKYSKCINEPILDCNLLDNITFSTFIVPTIYTTPNILIVLNSTSLIYPLSSTSIEQIIYSLSFCIIKKQMEFETKLKIKSSFFFDILYGNINNFSEFIKKGAKFGLRTNCKYVCISGSFDFNNPYIISKTQTMTNTSLYRLKVVESIEIESKKCNLDVIAFTQNNYFVTIFQVDRYNFNTHKEIENLILKVQNNHLKDCTISFGVSSYFTSIDQLKTAYLDSLEALNNGYDMEKYNFIQYYKLRESRDILQMIPRKTLSEFSNNILGDLISCDYSEKSMLLKTLKAYIDNKYDLSKTSRALYVHRNTIKYRLSRCEEILGVSLNDSGDSFTLLLALEINDMISSN
jgi:PucR family transcriptional regulator, purine catabolism regulatory protein